MEEEDMAYLESLPREVLMRVLIETPYVNLRRFCTVSRKLRSVCEDNYFWKLKTQDEFPETRKGSPRDWREEYLVRLRTKLEPLAPQFARFIVDGNVGAVKELVETNVVDINHYITDPESDPRVLSGRKSPIGLAYTYGQVDIVRYLTTMGATMNIGWSDNLISKTLVDGHVELAQWLIENVQDKRELQDPLNLVILSDSLHWTQFLIEKGADRNGFSHNITPLMAAASNGFLGIVRYLVENGVDLNIQQPHQGFTALMLAAAEGHVEVVHYLVENGADVETKDHYGRTAATLAKYEGIFDYLFKKLGWFSQLRESITTVPSRSEMLLAV